MRTPSSCFMKMNIFISRIIIVLGLIINISCSSEADHPITIETDASSQEPAEIVIGERLFLETRFAQAYYADQNKADPALQYTLTMDQPLRGPFAGKTMNCRACHMVDEHLEEKSAGMRSYADFIHNSPIPDRKDGQRITPRNSMSLVNINVASKHGVVFHFDGEFNSMEDLVRATLSGRNYGWKANETAQAIKHVADIIRKDDGKNELGKEFGGSYQRILTATDKDIPSEFLLPENYRLDIASANDTQIFDSVARLISAYVNDLNFATDDHGNYVGSPYDQFLKLNSLPQQPAEGESAKQYAERLLTEVNQLKSPKYVIDKNTAFKYHEQAFLFSEKELNGLKLFLTRGSETVRGGNCVSCHSAPHFSDYGFHNTGLSQRNYDELHGVGEFEKLTIPDLATRDKNYNEYLPATAKHPKASGRFRSKVDIDKPGHTDLGLWNVFANPDMPAPQKKLKNIMCEQSGRSHCKAEVLLPYTMAAFKTPVLRDLGHSNPYMHNGQFNSLEEVILFYVTNSSLLKNSSMMKSSQLLNADPELHSVNITGRDVIPLAAFLRALNEDYE